MLRLNRTIFDGTASEEECAECLEAVLSKLEMRKDALKNKDELAAKYRAAQENNTELDKET